MAFEQLRAEIEQLVQQMENEPDDIHELHARIRSKLNELKATGMPLPDDLVALEKRLDREERRPSAQGLQTGAEEARPARARRARPAKTARPAKAAKKTARASAKKSKRPAAKAGRRAGAAKAKRSPARAAAKTRRAGGARKARRSAGRRR